MIDWTNVNLNLPPVTDSRNNSSDRVLLTILDRNGNTAFSFGKYFYESLTYEKGWIVEGYPSRGKFTVTHWSELNQPK